MTAYITLVTQVGIAGSVTVGDGVVFGGQAAITDHVTIGDGARIGARSGITKSVPPGETMLGAPARPIRETKREFLDRESHYVFGKRCMLTVIEEDSPAKP